MANSGSESSFYDEATDYQLEDDGNDDRVLAQSSIGASHREPLADDSDAQDKENVEANDPMDCYHILLRLDLRCKSNFRNGEYQYLLRTEAHSLSNFVNSHLGPRSKSVQCVR